ncbi:hypothetical protein Salat_1183000 [Sesamum alatum]|uniref:Uncharacterized protein n=1 Tax=Sesamum alatum TaxID=300844 RepID=A0AAE1YEJ4_9LAMI|nr:hypothetical protein Salat_1183000 [Sesamum alatum]
MEDRPMMEKQETSCDSVDTIQEDKSTEPSKSAKEGTQHMEYQGTIPLSNHTNFEDNFANKGKSDHGQEVNNLRLKDMVKRNTDTESAPTIVQTSRVNIPLYDLDSATACKAYPHKSLSNSIAKAEGEKNDACLSRRRNIERHELEQPSSTPKPVPTEPNSGDHNRSTPQCPTSYTPNCSPTSTQPPQPMEHYIQESDSPYPPSF